MQAKGCLQKVSTSRVLVASVAAICVLGACFDSKDEPRAAPTPPPTEASALILLRENTIVRLDLETGEEEELGRVPAPDVFPIPGVSDRFLLVSNRGGGEDFVNDPRLSVIDDFGSRTASFGPGFSPLAAPDGARVAFLRTAGERVCEGEACVGAISVFVGDLEGETDPLLPPGDWRLISWAGDALIVSSSGRTLLAERGRDLEEIPEDPSEVWGATPDGALVVLVGPSGGELLDTGSGKRRPLDIEGPLAEGEWNRSGTELLVVEVGARDTTLVRVSTDGEVGTIAGSKGAAGPVLWGPSGSFLYVRAKGLYLEAVYCSRDESCRSVLRWKEGVLPLALQ